MLAVRLSSQNDNIYNLSQNISPRKSTGGFLKLKSYSKVNLYLDVIGKREDGYHNLISVMQAIDLCDELELSLQRESNINYTNFENINLCVLGDYTDLNTSSNLVVKALKTLMANASVKKELFVKLKKNIPVGGGLGGGSGNAAAALYGACKLLDLKYNIEDLACMGINLGSDVPFFLYGGTALVEGKGEKISSLKNISYCKILIANPGIFVSTREIFGVLDLSNKSSKLDIQNILQGIEKNCLHKTAISMYNVFTNYTAEKYPLIFNLISLLKKMGAVNADMTGTGSTVYALFDDETKAGEAYDELKKIIKSVYLTNPIPKECMYV